MAVQKTWSSFVDVSLVVFRIFVQCFMATCVVISDGISIFGKLFFGAPEVEELEKPSGIKLVHSHSATMNALETGEARPDAQNDGDLVNAGDVLPEKSPDLEPVPANPETPPASTETEVPEQTSATEVAPEPDAFVEPEQEEAQSDTPLSSVPPSPEPSRAADDAGKSSRESRTLVLKNFPFTINPDDVYKILNTCPYRPQRVVFLRNANGRFKGTVLAKYFTIQEAIESLHSLRSPMGLVVEGRTIGVVYKAPKKHKRHAIGEKPQDEEKIASLLGSNLLDTIGRQNSLNGQAAFAAFTAAAVPSPGSSSHPPSPKTPSHAPISPITRPKSAAVAPAHFPFMPGGLYSSAFASDTFQPRSAVDIFAAAH